jgi:hypothetical protein
MGLCITQSKTPKYVIQNGVRVKTPCEQHLEVTSQLFVFANSSFSIKDLDKNI